MIYPIQIREGTIPDTRYEHVPMLVDVANEINELRCERYMESEHVSACKEKEPVNEQEGRVVSDHSRCPWCSVT